MNDQSATKDTLFFGDPAGSEKSPEFGECYHAAAFLAANSAHRIQIVSRRNNDDWRLTEEFLNKLSPGSTKIVGEPSCDGGMGESADYFSSNHSEGLPRKVEEKFMPLLSGSERSGEIEEMARRFESSEPSCFLWIRHHPDHETHRNLSEYAFRKLLEVILKQNVRPILIGSRPPFDVNEVDANLIDFHTQSPYSWNPLLQLLLLNRICEVGSVKFSIGMMSGGMDGLAFARQLPTIFFVKSGSGGRMDEASKAFSSFKRISVSYQKEKGFERFSNSELGQIHREISEVLKGVSGSRNGEDQ